MGTWGRGRRGPSIQTDKISKSFRQRNSTCPDAVNKGPLLIYLCQPWALEIIHTHTLCTRSGKATSVGLRIIPRVWTFSRDLHNHECSALQNGFSKCMMKPVLMPRKDHKGARQTSWKTWVSQAQIWRWELYSETLQPWSPTSMPQVTREEARMHSLSWAPEPCPSLQEGDVPSYNAFSSGQVAQTDAPWRAPTHWKRLACPTFSGYTQRGKN